MLNDDLVTPGFRRRPDSAAPLLRLLGRKRKDCLAMNGAVVNLREGLLRLTQAETLGYGHGFQCAGFKAGASRSNIAAQASES